MDFGALRKVWSLCRGNDSRGHTGNHERLLTNRKHHSPLSRFCDLIPVLGRPVTPERLALLEHPNLPTRL